MKSKFVRRPSARRPSVASIIILVESSSWPYAQTFLALLDRVNENEKETLSFLFFRIFFRFRSYVSFPMGAKTSKRYSSLKSRLNLFNLSLNFLISGPHKSTVLDFFFFFEILSFGFFRIFFRFR